MEQWLQLDIKRFPSTSTWVVSPKIGDVHYETITLEDYHGKVLVQRYQRSQYRALKWLEACAGGSLKRKVVVCPK